MSRILRYRDIRIRTRGWGEERGRGERERERRERREGEERTINTHRNTDVNFAVSCVYDLKACMENKQSRGVRTRRHRKQWWKGGKTSFSGGKTSFSLLEFLARAMCWLLAVFQTYTQKLAHVRTRARTHTIIIPLHTNFPLLPSVIIVSYTVNPCVRIKTSNMNPKKIGKQRYNASWHFSRNICTVPLKKSGMHCSPFKILQLHITHFSHTSSFVTNPSESISSQWKRSFFTLEKPRM